MTPEGKVKKEIKEWLDSQGCYCFMPVQWGMGARTLDILICWRGHFIGVEVKRPGGEAKKFQQRIMRQIYDAGGRSICVDSLDVLQQFINWQDFS